MFVGPTHLIWRVSNLKRNPNYYYTWNASRTDDGTDCNIEHLHQHPIVAGDARYGCIFRLSSLMRTCHRCVPRCWYQSVYCLVRHFLVRIRIAKFLANSSRRFPCGVMYGKNTLSARKYTASAQLLWNWHEQRPSSEDDLAFSIKWHAGDLLVMSVLYRGTWLQLGRFVVRLMVSVLAIGSKVREFKPGRRRWIFKDDKNRHHAIRRRRSKAVSSTS
jgi:hypothetical protein